MDRRDVGEIKKGKRGKGKERRKRKKTMGFSQVFEFPNRNLYSSKISITKIYFRKILVVSSKINEYGTKSSFQAII